MAPTEGRVTRPERRWDCTARARAVPLVLLTVNTVSVMDTVIGSLLAVEL